ncbi:DUF2892 domain-containing protein [Tamlana crocina]
MEKNLGVLDKVLRIILSIITGILYYTGIIDGALGYILMVIAVICLITGFVSFCPLYSLFDIKTRNKKTEN